MMGGLARLRSLLKLPGRGTSSASEFGATDSGRGAPGDVQATAADAGEEGSARKAREVLDSIQLAVVFLGPTGRVTYCNGHLQELLGESRRAIAGQDWFERFIPPGQRDTLRAAFLEAIASGVLNPHNEHEIVATNGQRRLIAWESMLLRDATGKPEGVASLGTDVTERRHAEERLRHGAMYDALTRLPNRNLFMDRLAGCIARAKRRPQYRFAAVFLDIDRFSVVNNSLGHQAGDELLVKVGQRLAECLRPGDSVARLGGDEFAILLDEIGGPSVPSGVAARIQEALKASFDLGGREVFLTVSIGTALNKPRYEGPEDFMRDADAAMQHAKTHGKARHEVFDTSMHTRAMILLQIENDLHRAVEREELSVHYQPIVSLKTRALAGFEALVRWERSKGVFVPPGDFIGIAEETGLIVPIGAWVLREACRQVQAWQTRKGSEEQPLKVSVNLSAKQFAQPDLVAQVARVVQETGLAPGSLKLEVTESVLMQDLEAAAAMLTELDAQRVEVCIDDFGTGYSSLSHLLRFPAKTLKVDRSFVHGMSLGRRHAEMVRTIVGLAHNLEMDVIAEGVETEEQMARLMAMGCDYAQGYLISRPVDAEAAQSILDREALPLAGPSAERE